MNRLRFALLAILALLSTHAMAVDPVLHWRTFFRGGSADLTDGEMVRRTSDGSLLTVNAYQDSDGTFDIVVAKFGATGLLVWSLTLSPPGSIDAIARDMVVDTRGNVIVVGQVHDAGLGTRAFWATWKVTSAGQLLWYRSDLSGSAEAVEVDANGHVYQCGTTYAPNQNIVTRKLSGVTGNIWWTKSFSQGPNYEDVARDMAMDAAGNIYTTGHSYTGAVGRAQKVIKYLPNGERSWFRSFALADSEVSPSQIEARAGGGCVVAGSSLGSTSAAFMSEYDALGNLVFRSNFNFSSVGNEFIADFKQDADGNTYLAVNFQATLTDIDIFVVKLDNLGARVWQRRVATEGQTDQCEKVLLGEDSSLYLVGGQTTSSTSGQILVQKYSLLGARTWTYTYGGFNTDPEYARDAVIDEGKAIIIGYSTTAPNVRETVLFKIS